jgi:hypothetical protein
MRCEFRCQRPQFLPTPGRRVLLGLLPFLFVGAAGCGDGITGPGEEVTGVFTGSFSCGLVIGEATLRLDADAGGQAGSGMVRLTEGWGATSFTPPAGGRSRWGG